MILLTNYFQNPFDDRNVSLDELLAFTTDHLAKLTQNNPGGVYAARIAATTAALTAVSNTFTDDETKLGVRKARKQVKRAFRRALPGRIARLHAAVMARFGIKSGEVVECFPGGRLAFARCADDGLESHLAVLLRGLTAHAAELDATVLADAQAVRTEWLGVYQASEAATGTKAQTVANHRTARQALQRELFLNLLALVQAFPEQPEQLKLYMQPSLLTKLRRKKKTAAAAA